MSCAKSSVKSSRAKARSAAGPLAWRPRIPPSAIPESRPAIATDRRIRCAMRPRLTGESVGIDVKDGSSGGADPLFAVGHHYLPVLIGAVGLNADRRPVAKLDTQLA